MAASPSIKREPTPPHFRKLPKPRFRSRPPLHARALPDETTTPARSTSRAAPPRRPRHLQGLAMAATAADRGLATLLPVSQLALVAALSFLLLAPGAAAQAQAPAAPSPGIVFHVGGPRGWRVPDANTSYEWWAMNNRFHVDDHLYFKYAEDSVLQVDRPAFDACNATDPLASFSDGATTVRLDRPGFFCFISGEPGHCEEGQKLIVRVMVHPADHDHPFAHGPASAPAASGQRGHGGRPSPSGSSGAATAVAAGSGVAVAAAAAVLVTTFF
ncbi:hypothetical protein ACP70R_030132 [Stipagrostis hirtigluma subsp. patula]